MTARLNKYWRIWALVSAIARQSLTGLASFNNVKERHWNKQAIVPTHIDEISDCVSYKIICK